MSTQRDFDRTSKAWLAEGPTELADRVLDAALDEVHSTHQRRHLWALPWRTQTLNSPQRVAAGIAIVAFLGYATLSIIGRGPSSGAVPTASPAAPSPSPQSTLPAADTSTWVAFTSHFYGFTVSHPSDWTVVPGTGRWTTTQSDAALDIITSPSGPPSPINPPNFMGYEAKVPSGMTAETFIHNYTSTAYDNAGYPVPAATTQITVDGHPATLANAGCVSQYFFAEATVVVGDRVWFFDLHGPDRSLLLAFLSTVKLDPTQTID